MGVIGRSTGNRIVLFDEYSGKDLLRAHGIATPLGFLCGSPAEASNAARRMGDCVVKAQIPAGKRGKSGGVRFAASPKDAGAVADSIMGTTISGFRVRKVLVEQRVRTIAECYVAVISDTVSKGPLVLFSLGGGVDVEDTADDPHFQVHTVPVDIRTGINPADIAPVLGGLGSPEAEASVLSVILRLYDAYRASDAELLEINPLGLLENGDAVALDCKFVMDDQALERQKGLSSSASVEPLTALEARAAERGLKYIELPGTVGILANGAGLTMATMDAVTHYGGAPANFLEIGGDAYTKGRDALELVLANPSVRSLLVNFCGAFARTDVMADGLTEAWLQLKPTVPVFFSIHGTGEDDAIALVNDRLGVEPFDLMDDAVLAAVRAAT